MSNTQRIAVVLDDDALSARGMTFNLADWGYRTRTAESCAGLGPETDAQQVDLVVVDCWLGGRDGIGEALKLADRAGRRLPTIVMTDGHDAHEMLAAGRHGFAALCKPVDPLLLEAVIARVSDR